MQQVDPTNGSEGPLSQELEQNPLTNSKKRRSKEIALTATLIHVSRATTFQLVVSINNKFSAFAECLVLDTVVGCTVSTSGPRTHFQPVC